MDIPLCEKMNEELAIFVDRSCYREAVLRDSVGGGENLNLEFVGRTQSDVVRTRRYQKRRESS